MLTGFARQHFANPEVLAAFCECKPEQDWPAGALEQQQPLTSMHTGCGTTTAWDLKTVSSAHVHLDGARRS
eukprot:12083342-Prorocentrum_lima.AAC.1